MNIGPFLGESLEYMNLGLVRGPSFGLSSGGLKNQQKISFFGDSQQEYLININYVDNQNNSGDNGWFYQFLKSTNGGGIDKTRLISNPRLMEQFYEAYTIHILAHIYEDCNQGSPLIDLMMVQANLGHDYALEIVKRVCKRLLNNQSQLFNSNRIRTNWSNIATDRSEEKMFYLTVDGVNVYLGYLLVLFSILDQLYECPNIAFLIEIIKSRINLSSSHLGWLRVIEQLTIHSINQGPYFGYALDDIYGCVEMLKTNSGIAKQYYTILHTYHLQDWIEEVYDVDYLSADFVSTTRINIDMSLSYLSSMDKFRETLDKKSFFDGTDILSNLNIYWGRNWLTVQHSNISYYANHDGTVDVYNSNNQENYTVEGFGDLIELLQFLRSKPFEL
jgi:hypothetical protein